MAGRFNIRFRPSGQADLGLAVEPPPQSESWTVSPEPVPPSEPAAPAPNPLLSDKLLDAKVRLHRRLIEEINLQALERLPEDAIKAQVQELVSQYILSERIPAHLVVGQCDFIIVIAIDIDHVPGHRANVLNGNRIRRQCLKKMRSGQLEAMIGRERIVEIINVLEVLTHRICSRRKR